MGRFLLGMLFLLAALPAAAHPLDDSYVTLAVDGARVSVRWEISLRDLDPVVDIDGDGDRRISDAEVERRAEAMLDYALPRLVVTGDQACARAGVVERSILDRGDRRYVALRYALDCGRVPTRLEATYSLFFDVHPEHRALVAISSPDATWSGVLNDSERSMAVALAAPGRVDFASYFVTGLRHMLEGIDHLLFLAVVLLPILLAPASGLMRPLIEAAKILTAFTLAHGLTLWLAALGIIVLPPWLVESAIALSIAITALDNVRPFLGRRRWLVAFGFGLVHGLGFAGALGPLALPTLALVTALLAFNLGLEVAQLGVALIALPLLRLLGSVRRVALPLGSAIAGLVALLWFAERAFAVAIFS